MSFVVERVKRLVFQIEKWLHLTSLVKLCSTLTGEHKSCDRWERVDDEENGQGKLLHFLKNFQVFIYYGSSRQNRLVVENI